jgi:hypothetical protein
MSLATCRQTESPAAHWRGMRATLDHHWPFFLPQTHDATPGATDMKEPKSARAKRQQVRNDHWKITNVVALRNQLPKPGAL